MSSATFTFLCNRLRPHLESKPNVIRQPLSVEKKVAIALYKLASCAEYRVVANQFGTHKSVVGDSLYLFCKAVMKEFRHEYLIMPNAYECEEISTQFENMCGIPHVIGAIDGSHIPILPPKDGYRDFINRKGWASYNMLAVVDSRYRFRYATCQHPGCTHDALVLKDSNLYKKHEELIAAPQNELVINGVQIPYFLLGDPAYPLLPWLIKGYKGNLTPQQESFNAYHSSGRVVVENAFGRLKARFRCLLKRLDIDYLFVPTVVFTCLILHNIIETRKDAFQHRWMEWVREAEVILPQPTKSASREHDNMTASDVREALSSYMTTFPLRRSKLA